MGLLINNELIWISVPRCASVSIERALLNSNLNIKRLQMDEDFEDTHFHFQKSVVYEQFGIHKTICIKRDWFSKWMSGLYHLFYWLDFTKIYTPIIKWENIDNNFIYKTFDTDFANAIYKKDTDDWDIAFLRLIKETSMLYGPPFSIRSLQILQTHISIFDCCVLEHNFYWNSIF